jgi:ribosomal protein S21
MINAEVVKTGNENNLNLIRRFTKRVQGAGILPRVRSIRYSSRKASEYVKKKKTLKVLKRRAEVNELLKMGKMTEYTKGAKR